MIKVAAAFLLLLGSGVIFWALVSMDAPSFRPRFVTRRFPNAIPNEAEPAAPTLRRAA